MKKAVRKIKRFFENSRLNTVTWIFLLILFFSIIITSVCIVAAVDHRSSRTALISANITDVEVYKYYYNVNKNREKEISGYNLYVDYTYNGEKYKHIFYGFEKNIDKAQIGRKVYVRFYKDYPSALVKNSDNVLLIAFPVTFIILGFTVYLLKCDLFYKKSKKHHHSKTRKIKRKIRHFINKRRFKQNKLNKHRR